MIFRDILNEVTYVRGTNPRIWKNPSQKDLLDLVSTFSHGLKGLKGKTTEYIWNPYDMTHYNAKEQLKDLGIDTSGFAPIAYGSSQNSEVFSEYTIQDQIMIVPGLWGYKDE
jgi:hypothetical protein